MMRLLRLWIVLLVTVPVLLGEAAPVALRHLRRAEGELGAAHWSAILELSTTNRAQPTRHALVFEFANALWFYRPADGTQSLSRHWNNVAAERAELLPLLQRVDPSVVAFRECEALEFSATVPSTGELPNGCFIRSVSEARRLEREQAITDGCLLSYYAETREGQRGHTVLVYQDRDGSHLFDPAEERTTDVASASLYDEAIDLARNVTPFGLATRLTKAAKIALFGSGQGSAKASARSAKRAPVLR